MRALAPAIPTAYLVFDLSADPTIPERAAAAGDVAVNPWDPLVDAAFMAQRCDELGLQVNAWTVDDPMRIVELARLGCTASSRTSRRTPDRCWSPPACSEGDQMAEVDDDARIDEYLRALDPEALRPSNGCGPPWPRCCRTRSSA